MSRDVVAVFELPVDADVLCEITGALRDELGGTWRMHRAADRLVVTAADLTPDQIIQCATEAEF